MPPETGQNAQARERPAADTQATASKQAAAGGPADAHVSTGDRTEPGAHAEPGARTGSEAAQAERGTQAEGRFEPRDGTEGHAQPEDADVAVAPIAGGRRALLAAAVLGLAAVVLAGFGVWASLEAHSLRQTAAARNAALTDRAATSEVSRQIATAVNTVFSFSYADTAKTRQAAQHLLTGPAIRQYDRLFTVVQRQAPAQKLVLTTTVTSTGVEFLAGDHARVLIFADQQDTRAGTHQTTYGGAMFAVTALRQDGRWKIENIDTFSG